MNESASFRPLALAALLFVLVPGGCVRPAEPAPLQGATMGGAFSLVDQNGRRVRDTDFAGRYRLVYFGFTFCPDVCPVDLQTIGAGLRRFEAASPERAARVQPIFITVDPARDTPDMMRRYVAAFHPRLLGLTGNEADITATARAYRIFFERGEPGADGGYSVNHTRMAVLYGPAGEPIAIIPHDQGPDGVAAELERRVR